ncbi:MAG: hypothetical protein N3E45_06665 [Oscillatoriaceae bacterium SKW80]|nr:hypothetical protein [Oscillatoriaceae bacterium SKYG93]MCX8120499.1 hypothetical protein [Oscillatoriaceae bacterium SKW80]MDW8452737.1 hypothetical protein [Oscillatoriaceae cyanobacterium SKYGB_i_bin93]HIK27193.1 hypothetical protein [Oscillatoriaceae cyanobacterium M7585_C2015_266]
MDAYEDFLRNGIERRLMELQEQLKQLIKLNSRCQEALDKLEATINSGFDRERHADIFQKAISLIKALVELIRTPLVEVDNNGK